MSNRLYHGIIHQMKDSVSRIIGVIDESGAVIACSELNMMGEVRRGIQNELTYSSGTITVDGFTYRAIGTTSRIENCAFVEGTDDVAAQICSVLAISLSNLKNLYDEKYDKCSFIKSVMLDNILVGDIPMKSKELRFKSDEPRVVYLVKFSGKTEMMPYEMVQNLFPDKNRDYVVSISDHEIVLVHELRQNNSPKDIVKIATTMSETLASEFYCKVSVGISGVAENIKELAKCYKEAQIALEVGKVFDTEKNIISYENLGIGRLIYQLPTTLCEMFLREVFKKGSLDDLDREMMQTVQKFFENDLNVSETSRKLYCHRNTLVYRLDKIHKITGLDLRNFEDAITFKVALMVKKYLISKPEKY